ncbi:MAG: TfuA-like protein [Actinomycetota bacterium]
MATDASHIVVFAGPSVDRATIDEIIPGAIVHPPAGQADLVNCVDRDRPHVVALIDGVFDQRLSVWHKELLYALHRGVHVYGASSIGALRAAETSIFGTVGVGRVFQWYADGVIDGDDEVAVMHADAEHGYRPLSIPHVNVRATMQLPATIESLESTMIELVLECSRDMHYVDRTVASILAAVAAAGVDDTTLGDVETILRDQFVDQKRADAIELLTRLATLPNDIAPFSPAFEFEVSPFFAALRERDRTAARGGVEVSFAELAYHLSLHMEEFEQFNAAAVDRLALLSLAPRFGIDVDDGAVDDEIARLQRRFGLDDDDALEQWCRRNDLTDEDFRALMRDEAICRRLRRFAVSSNLVRGTARALVDALRLAGRYEEWMDAAGELHASVDGDVFDSLRTSEMTLTDLLADHARETGWRPAGAFESWWREAGYRDLNTLRVELLRAHLARAADDQRL